MSLKFAAYASLAIAFLLGWLLCAILQSLLALLFWCLIGYCIVGTIRAAVAIAPTALNLVAFVRNSVMNLFRPKREVRKHIWINL